MENLVEIQVPLACFNYKPTFLFEFITSEIKCIVFR